MTGTVRLLSPNPLQRKGSIADDERTVEVKARVLSRFSRVLPACCRTRGPHSGLGETEERLTKYLALTLQVPVLFGLPAPEVDGLFHKRGARPPQRLDVGPQDEF